MTWHFDMVLNKITFYNICRRRMPKTKSEMKTGIFLVMVCLLVGVESAMFCFIKHSKPASNATLIITDSQNSAPLLANSTIVNETHVESQLRSYHPHYLNSISYPYPITPHIYYGQVIGSSPIFLFKDMDKWNPSTIQKLTINGHQFTDASAKYYLLRREEEFRYMLVLQMQNSFDHEISASIDFFKKKDHYLIVCEYENRIHAFSIYLTFKGQPMELSEEGLRGVNVYVRNESTGSVRQNWRFSESLNWRGRNNIVDMNSSSFVGLIIEIQYFDRNLLRDVKINLKEEPITKGQTPQFYAKKDSAEVLVDPNVQKVNKYDNCSNSATQKVFDGLSYEFGTLQIKNGYHNVPNEAKQLLSFCPSRKRFPWGFLWDDGFHCEVGVRKNEELVIKVIKSWLNTMMDNGWIPRQQNRGAERQHLCSCPRFMEKDMRDGNPPTLLLALDYLKRKGRLTPSIFAHEYWIKIKRWYEWFLSTQKDGDIYIFKWHDSINQMGASFTSGMDDFPRPLYSKGHIDLQAWMYFFTKFMVEASHIFGDSSMEYITNLELIKSNFKFFIDMKNNLYKDIANDTTPSEHYGYPNILPIAFGVPEYHSTEYNASIRAVKEQLDSGAGLSSISKHSPHYLENKDAYWKGPVWLNINYLFLRGLKLYYPQERELYEKLRADLLRVVCGNWESSGYFYENYIHGRGSFSYPFNGWTSLIAIISTQNY